MKRIIPFILSLTLAFSGMNIVHVSADEVNDPAYKLGDINSDGNINAADALLVLQHAAKLTTVDEKIADVDLSLNVNATDALYILQYAAHIIPNLPGEVASTPIPTETVEPPVPTDPAHPTETVEPSESPIPTESAQPTETAAPSESPIPTESAQPTETAAPSETPIPTESAQPTETAKPSESPIPTESAQPTATPTPVENIKTHIKANGFAEEDGSYSIGYTYEDDTVSSVVNYNPITDALIFDLTYQELSTERETMVVSITMDYDEKRNEAGEFTEIVLFVKYSNNELTQSYKAQTAVIPKNVTEKSTFKFTEISSENCSALEITAILSMASLYVQSALSLWDDVLSIDINMGLRDIGFTNYIVVE